MSSEFDAYGDDKTYANCRSRFDGPLNFKNEPYVPAPPTRRSSLDLHLALARGEQLLINVAGKEMYLQLTNVQVVPGKPPRLELTGDLRDAP